MNGAKRLAAGVDIGGSHVSAGIVDEDWKLLARRHKPLGADRGPEAVAASVARILGECLEEFQAAFGAPDRGAARRGTRGRLRLAGIGVGVPAAVLQPGSRVAVAPNLGWRDVDVGRILEGAVSVLRRRADLGPVIVENDANLAAFGEWSAGAARGSRVAVCVTLGTGIGGGIVVDGAILEGAHGIAGEVGHTKVSDRGPVGEPCGCGGRGCLEAVSSGSAMVRRAMAAGVPGVTREGGAMSVFEAVRRGDERAARIVEEAGRYLGIGLAQLACILDPDVIVIGGAVAGAWDLVVEPAIREMRACVPVDAGVRVERAKLGPDAGIFGGAALSLARRGRRPHARTGADRRCL